MGKKNWKGKDQGNSAKIAVKQSLWEEKYYYNTQWYLASFQRK